MGQYIIVYSRYVITILAILYALCAFGRLLDRPRRYRVYDNLQSALIFLIQFSAFLTICVETGSMDYLFFYAFAQLLLFASMTLYLMLYPGMNRLLLNNVSFLVGTGLIILVRLDMDKAFRQMVIVAVSVGLSMVIPMLVRRFTQAAKRLGWFYAGIGTLALAAVLILGQLTNGSRLSFTVAGLTFQPSEFVKILFVLFLAAMLWKDASLKRVALCVCLSALQVLILVFSKDLGSALIYFIACVFVIFFATGKYIYLLLGAVGGSVCAYVAAQVFTHVQVRVQAWKDPWSVIDSQGYQITQSLFAMSRGSWFGLGIGQGTPGDIPYVDTDFVFAAVAEELGILFGACVILVCLSSFFSILKTAAQEEDRFLRLAASGFGVMYVFQIFLTIGGGTKFIPLTGVTLPFISYGGSSVMSTVFIFSLIQGICHRQAVLREREARRLRKQQKRLQREGQEPTEDEEWNEDYQEEYWDENDEQ